MQHGFVLPLSDLARKVLNRIQDDKKEIKQKVINKTKPNLSSLSSKEIEFVKLLLSKNVDLSEIAKIVVFKDFSDVPMQSKNRHANRENLFMNILIKSVDTKELNRWFEQNKEFVLNKIECSELDIEYKILLINKLGC